jgi:hypothetical protein
MEENIIAHNQTASILPLTFEPPEPVAAILEEKPKFDEL